MSFTPGNKLAVGRPKGSINKRSAEFLSILEEENFDAARAMISFCRKAEQDYEEARGTEDAPKYLKIASDMAKELATYSYPKLKAIEKTQHDPLKDLTPQQRLELMEQAVKLFKLELHGPGNS